MLRIFFWWFLLKLNIFIIKIKINFRRSLPFTHKSLRNSSPALNCMNFDQNKLQLALSNVIIWKWYSFLDTILFNGKKSYFKSIETHFKSTIIAEIAEIERFHFWIRKSSTKFHIKVKKPHFKLRKVSENLT